MKRTSAIHGICDPYYGEKLRPPCRLCRRAGPVPSGPPGSCTETDKVPYSTGTAGAAPPSSAEAAVSKRGLLRQKRVVRPGRRPLSRHPENPGTEAEEG